MPPDIKVGIDWGSASANQGGTGVYVRSIAEGWRNAGRSFAQLSGRPAGTMDHGGKSALSRIANGLRDIAWIQAGLSRAARKANCNVLFCPAFLSPVLPSLPTVVTVHDVGFLRNPRHSDALYRRYISLSMSMSLRRVSAVITVSNFSKSEIVRLLAVPESKVHVVHNACSAAFTTAAPAGSDEAVLSGRGIRKPYLLSVGTLEPRKNLRSLLDAFALVRSRGHANLRLVLAGARGWGYDDLLRRVSKPDIAPFVTLTGFLPEHELAALYRQAQALVFPSLYEGFGIPVLEAMACGCPVLAGRVASIPEVAGDAALLVETVDTTAIADGITRLLQSPELRAGLREAGPRQSSRFSWARTADETWAVVAAAAATTNMQGLRHD